MRRMRYWAVLMIILAAILNSCSEYFVEVVNSNDQNLLACKEFKLESESSIIYLAFTENQMVIVEFDKDEEIFVNPYFGPFVQNGNKIKFPLGMPGRTELSEIDFNLAYGILTLKSPEESKVYDQM